MDKFILNYFSDQQKWVIRQRITGASYSKICAAWPFKEIVNSSPKQKKDENVLYNANIICCLRRSALGYEWKKGMEGGGEMYLCPEDMDNLKSLIYSAAQDGSPYDTGILIDKAYELKMIRYDFGLEFLEAIKADSIFSEITEKRDREVPPVRSWINGVLADLLISIRTTRFIDILRKISCTPENIQNYFEIAAEIISRIHPFLLFGADETMLFPSVRKKVVLPANVQSEFITAKTTLPHFSAMCSHNIYGRSFANFIILPNLKNLPAELSEFADIGDVTFCSSKSGWQTKETFLMWVICFINDVSVYRQDLPEEIRDQEALLIIDGHSSRENPFAMQLLAEAKISVLVLPSHTSHLLQIFDVSLASPLKRMFSDLFNEGIRKLEGDHVASTLRKLVISSFLTAWKSVCTLKNCQSGASATGTFPCNVEIPLASRFVEKLNPRYQEKAQAHREYAEKMININARVITDNEELSELNRKLQEKGSPDYCLIHEGIAYTDAAKLISSLDTNNCKLLSKFPKYIDAEGKVVHLN